MSTCFGSSHSGGGESGSDEGSSDFAPSLEENSEDEVMMHMIMLFLP